MTEEKNVKIELEDDDKTFISHNDKMNSIIELHKFYNEIMNRKPDDGSGKDTEEDTENVYMEEFVDRFKSNLSTHVFSIKKFSPIEDKTRVKSIFLNYVSDIIFVEYKNYRRRLDERNGDLDKVHGEIENEELQNHKEANTDFEFTTDDLFFLITTTMNIIEELSAIVCHHSKYGDDVSITKYDFLLNYIKSHNTDENVMTSPSPKKYLDETIIEIANALHKVIEMKGNNKKRLVLSLLKKTIFHIYREYYGEVISEIQSIELSYYIDLIQNGLLENIIDVMVKVSNGDVYLNNVNGFISYTKEMLSRENRNKCIKLCSIL